MKLRADLCTVSNNQEDTMHWIRSISVIALSLVLVGCGDEPVCRDGATDTTEECDDGNEESGDGCDFNCTLTACGNGIIANELGQPAEECDDGNLSDTDECTTQCKNPVCGDGFVQEGVETCDDGNQNANDSCTTACTIADCGDGFVFNQGGGTEQCDDTNEDNNDGCLNSCQDATCGDGIIRPGVEACDDGDQAGGDGCSSICTLELDFVCSGEPTVCIPRCENLVPGADLRDCDLSNADLVGIDLTGADLSGADLSGANLSNASLVGAKTGELVGCSSILPNGSFRCAFSPVTGFFAIIGPSVDLSGAGLHFNNLSGVDLSGANLGGAKTGDLFGCPAVLPSGDFSCILAPSIGRFAILGPFVNLQNVNLSGTDLNGTNLNFVVLTNTNLNGASGQPANAGTALYGNTTCPNGANSDSTGDTCVGQGF
jgi:cysteine-rich repeat protein